MKDLGNKSVMAVNLKYYMQTNNVKTAELSKAIAVPYTTVRSWLRAENYPRIDKIELMADYFGILKSDLIEDKSAAAFSEINEKFAPMQEAIDRATASLRNLDYTIENKRKKNLTLAHEELIQMVENIPDDKVEWILSVMKSILADEK